MNCRACEYALPADAVFCPECGVKVEGARGGGGEVASPASEPIMAEAALPLKVAAERVPAPTSPRPGPGTREAGGLRRVPPEGSYTPPSPLRSVPGGTHAALDGLLARANLLRMRGQWAEAIERCTEALRLDPHSGAAHSLLGDIYENQGRLDKASHWYQLAMEQNPDSIADKAKLARVRELQAVRKRTGDPRFSWAYLVAVAGVAFLFVAFVMAVIVAGNRGAGVSAMGDPRPMPQFPASAIPRVQPLDHTDAEEKLANYLIAELHSRVMKVTGVMFDPSGREATITARMGDEPITEDPMGGGRRAHVLREGYRIAWMARQHQLGERRELQTVTVRALMRFKRPGGSEVKEYAWRGRIDATRLAVGDDKASPNEVQAVYDPQQMYWHPEAGF